MNKDIPTRVSYDSALHRIGGRGEMYTANGWVNYYVGILWLIAFVVFVFLKYPSEKEE